MSWEHPPGGDWAPAAAPDQRRQRQNDRPVEARLPPAEADATGSAAVVAALGEGANGGKPAELAVATDQRQGGFAAQQQGHVASQQQEANAPFPQQQGTVVAQQRDHTTPLQPQMQQQQKKPANALIAQQEGTLVMQQQDHAALKQQQMRQQPQINAPIAQQHDHSTLFQQHQRQQQQQQAKSMAQMAHVISGANQVGSGGGGPGAGLPLPDLPAVNIVPKPKGAVVAKRKGRFSVLRDPALGNADREQAEKKAAQEKQQLQHQHQNEQLTDLQPAASANTNGSNTPCLPNKGAIDMRCTDPIVAASQQQDLFVAKQDHVALSLQQQQQQASSLPQMHVSCLVPTNLPIGTVVGGGAPQANGGTGGPTTGSVPTVKIVPGAIVAKRKGRFSVLQDPALGAEGPSIVLTSGGGAAGASPLPPPAPTIAGPVPGSQPPPAGVGTGGHSPRPERKVPPLLMALSSAKAATDAGAAVPDAQTVASVRPSTSCVANGGSSVAATATATVPSSSPASAAAAAAATVPFQAPNQAGAGMQATSPGHCVNATASCPTAGAALQQPILTTGPTLYRPAGATGGGSGLQQLPPGTKKKGRFVLLSTSEPVTAAGGGGGPTVMPVSRPMVLTAAAGQPEGPGGTAPGDSRLVLTTGAAAAAKDSGKEQYQQPVLQLQQPPAPHQMQQMQQQNQPFVAQPQHAVSLHNQPLPMPPHNSPMNFHHSIAGVVAAGPDTADHVPLGMVAALPELNAPPRKVVDPPDTTTPSVAAAKATFLGYHSASLSSLEGKGPVGVHGALGLGKVFYFLDQMRLEVTEADRTIKSLQRDIKFLKEKNKELETRKNAFERRFNEERSIREASESKVRSLKKKVKELKEMISSASLCPSEDGGNRAKHGEDKLEGNGGNEPGPLHVCDDPLLGPRHLSASHPPSYPRFNTSAQNQCPLASKGSNITQKSKWSMTDPVSQAHQSQGMIGENAKSSRRFDGLNSCGTGQSPDTAGVEASSPSQKQFPSDSAQDTHYPCNTLAEENTLTTASFFRCDTKVEEGGQSLSQRDQLEKETKRSGKAQGRNIPKSDILVPEQNALDKVGFEITGETESSFGTMVQSVPFVVVDPAGVVPSASSCGQHGAERAGVPMSAGFDPLCSVSNCVQPNESSPIPFTGVSECVGGGKFVEEGKVSKQEQTSQSFKSQTLVISQPNLLSSSQQSAPDHEQRMDPFDELAFRRAPVAGARGTN